MRELFVEDGPDTARAQHLSPDAAQEIRDAIAGRNVCPFCGAVRELDDAPCPRCSMDNTSASRQATKARIGPWYVFQSRNPAAPGMKFETLLSFVRKGRVKARSVVRGPTTHQLWRFAAHVKGLSREFGICYSCGGSIDRVAGLCPHCNRSQEPPVDPDVFIEGQQPAVISEAAAARNLGPMPLAAEDMAVPPLDAAPASNRTGDPTKARAKREAALPDDDDTRMKRAEGFLSPQDLAAAFNLDFRPKGRQARAGQQQSQATAVARRPEANARKKKPARWGRRIFFLLFLGAIGAGAYAYQTKPEFRARTNEYSKQAVVYSKQAIEWGKQKWAEFNQPAKKTSHTTAPAIDATPEPSAPATNELKAPPASPVLPVPPGASHEVPPPVKQEVPATIPAPAKAVEAPSEAKSDAWEKIYGKQESQQKTEPQQKTEAPKSDSSDAASAVTPNRKVTGTIDDVRTLYRQAIDAEANNDFAGAVKKYEQIKQFSPDLWPADLNLRLTQAKRQAQ